MSWARIWPRPPALLTIQMASASRQTASTGAAQFSNHFTAFMPRQMMTICMTQNRMKHSHIVHGSPPISPAPIQLSPNSLPRMMKVAWPPIQVWMPNQPHATSPRRIAARFAPRTP